MSALSPRDTLILTIVREGGGRLESRQIDIRYSQRMAHTEDRLFDALDRLERSGFLVRHTTPGSPFDRYEITALGGQLLDEAGSLG